MKVYLRGRAGELQSKVTLKETAMKKVVTYAFLIYALSFAAAGSHAQEVNPDEQPDRSHAFEARFACWDEQAVKLMIPLVIKGAVNGKDIDVVADEAHRAGIHCRYGSFDVADEVAFAEVTIGGDDYIITRFKIRERDVASWKLKPKKTDEDI
jgi:hypothetical protein